ncbi:helix-turn-helix domain-containing protein [Catenovulum sediminis]|uniref:Transcriptional regulator n=1 Tax=Catenovulum sediminis TaxID=1740262 RepID=A0ABV1RCT7_9ALTE
MNLQRIEQGLSHIAAEASFIIKIKNATEHGQALELMEQLIEDYDRHEPLIDMLSMSIEKYENTADEFQAFNDELKQLNSGVAALSVLMDQYKLNTTDFENEIGKKSLVSMILNGKRPLNLNHIRKLSERFNLLPQTFI